LVVIRSEEAQLPTRVPHFDAVKCLTVEEMEDTFQKQIVSRRPSEKRYPYFNVDLSDFVCRPEGAFELTCGSPMDKLSYIAGVNTPYAYYSRGISHFGAHIEDWHFASYNIVFAGATKLWVAVKPSSRQLFEKKIREVFPEAGTCVQFIRHLAINIAPSVLREWGVEHSFVPQNPGQVVAVTGMTYHWGINTGHNYAEAINFCMEKDWKASEEFINCYHGCGIEDHMIPLPKPVFEKGEMAEKKQRAIMRDVAFRKEWVRKTETPVVTQQRRLSKPRERRQRESTEQTQPNPTRLMSTQPEMRPPSRGNPAVLVSPPRKSTASRPSNVSNHGGSLLESIHVAADPRRLSNQPRKMARRSTYQDDSSALSDVETTDDEPPVIRAKKPMRSTHSRHTSGEYRGSGHLDMNSALAQFSNALSAQFSSLTKDNRTFIGFHMDGKKANDKQEELLRLILRYEIKLVEQTEKNIHLEQKKLDFEQRRLALEQEKLVIKQKKLDILQKTTESQQRTEHQLMLIHQALENSLLTTQQGPPAFERGNQREGPALRPESQKSGATAHVQSLRQGPFIAARPVNVPDDVVVAARPVNIPESLVAAQPTYALDDVIVAAKPKRAPESLIAAPINASGSMAAAKPKVTQDEFVPAPPMADLDSSEVPQPMDGAESFVTFQPMDTSDNVTPESLVSSQLMNVPESLVTAQFTHTQGRVIERTPIAADGRSAAEELQLHSGRSLRSMARRMQHEVAESSRVVDEHVQSPQARPITPQLYPDPEYPQAILAALSRTHLPSTTSGTSSRRPSSSAYPSGHATDEDARTSPEFSPITPHNKSFESTPLDDAATPSSLPFSMSEHGFDGRIPVVREQVVDVLDFYSVNKKGVSASPDLDTVRGTEASETESRWRMRSSVVDVTDADSGNKDGDSASLNLSTGTYRSIEASRTKHTPGTRGSVVPSLVTKQSTQPTELKRLKCTACHKKKQRCDKKEPECTNCAGSATRECIYPEPKARRVLVNRSSTGTKLKKRVVNEVEDISLHQSNKRMKVAPTPPKVAFIPTKIVSTRTKIASTLAKVRTPEPANGASTPANDATPEPTKVASTPLGIAMSQPTIPVEPTKAATTPALTVDSASGGRRRGGALLPNSYGNRELQNLFVSDTWKAS
jgi:hypothetical protein